MRLTLGKLAVVSLIFIGLTLPGMAVGKGNARKGKYLYRKYCRTCHKENATGDRAGKPLSPISKTQAQWDVVFKTYKKLPCADRWSKLKPKDRKDIYAHLWGHAFDSPSPAKCQ